MVSDLRLNGRIQTWKQKCSGVIVCTKSMQSKKKKPLKRGTTAQVRNK